MRKGLRGDRGERISIKKGWKSSEGGKGRRSQGGKGLRGERGERISAGIGGKTS